MSATTITPTAATLSTLTNVEHTLIGHIHEAAASLDKVGTSKLADALEALHNAADEAKDRLTFAVEDLQSTLTDVLSHVQGLLAGITAGFPVEKPTLTVPPASKDEVPAAVAQPAVAEERAEAKAKAEKLASQVECPGITPRPISLQRDHANGTHTLTQDSTQTADPVSVPSTSAASPVASQDADICDLTRDLFSQPSAADSSPTIATAACSPADTADPVPAAPLTPASEPAALTHAESQAMASGGVLTVPVQSQTATPAKPAKTRNARK